MAIEILLIPCIILMLMLVGREASFFLKKYPPTSPSVAESRQLFFSV